MNTKAKLLILLSSLAFSPYVLSGDYQVISGTATSSTSGSKTTIENSLHAILHWDDFSIAEKNHLHFAQVNAASTVLNRVTGNSLSALMGTLTS
ncbi:MAG: filamentous hemagglutinin N-terminal domain-containing protein, partial [Rhabdochlamydiaceae bacterium]|nr:filamentous hemagglutinin N-terminal domain-containing protein [Rhabdochlamydiaceae bacterium]